MAIQMTFGTALLDTQKITFNSGSNSGEGFNYRNKEYCEYEINIQHLINKYKKYISDTTYLDQLKGIKYRIYSSFATAIEPKFFESTLISTNPNKYTYKEVHNAKILRIMPASLYAAIVQSFMESFDRAAMVADHLNPREVFLSITDYIPNTYKDGYFFPTASCVNANNIEWISHDMNFPIIVISYGGILHANLDADFAPEFSEFTNIPIWAGTTLGTKQAPSETQNEEFQKTMLYSNLILNELSI